MAIISEVLTSPDISKKRIRLINIAKDRLKAEGDRFFILQPYAISPQPLFRLYRIIRYTPRIKTAFQRLNILEALI